MKKNYTVLLLALLLAGACSIKEKPKNEVAKNLVVENSEYQYSAKLHPLSKAYLQKVAQRNYDNIKIPAMRKGLKSFGAKLFGTAKEGAIIENDTIKTSEAAIPIRIYRSDSLDVTNPLPVIVYYHGGAWCFGGLNMVDYFGTSLTEMMDVILVSVDYRLAPEHPYPAGLNDSYQALQWVAENIKSLGGDPDKIIVSGGSAGGNLATVVALKARDENGPQINGQVLFYPVTDLYSLDSYSYKTYGHNFGLQIELMEKTIKAYVPTKADRKAGYVSPLMAESLADLPQTLIITAGFDPLRDEGEAYAKRLEEAGVAVNLSRYDSMVHGFVTFAKVYPNQAHKATKEMATTLQTWFTGNNIP